VIMSHAHIDHSGLLPRLVREGFSGPIHCNEPTRDLLAIMLMDSAKIQESDLKHVNKRRLEKGLPELEPLYDAEDVRQVMRQIDIMPDHSDYWDLCEGVAVRSTVNAHILGSVALTLAILDGGREKKLMKHICCASCAKPALSAAASLLFRLSVLIVPRS